MQVPPLFHFSTCSYQWNVSILSAFLSYGKFFDNLPESRYNEVRFPRRHFVSGKDEAMTIIHPLQPVNGLNPEDVFYAVDDLGAQTGYGFILY